MDILVKIGRFQIKQNVLNLKSTLVMGGECHIPIRERKQTHIPFLKFQTLPLSKIFKGCTNVIWWTPFTLLHSVGLFK